MERKNNQIIPLIGVLVLSFASLLYFAFGRNFAEINLSVKFLDFPVFIGEIVLFLSFILFVVCVPKISLRNQGFWLIFFCFLFIAFKVVSGYISWGPLALRHAALFYYSFFALFSYFFFSQTRVPEFLKYSWVIVNIIIFKITSFYQYSFFTNVILTVILIMSMQGKKRKLFFVVLLLLFIPYSSFWQGSRTMLLSNSLSLLLLLVLSFFILRLLPQIKVLLLMGLFSLFVTVSFQVKNEIKIKSIYDFKGLREGYVFYDNYIKQNKPSFVFPKPKKVKLYNPEKDDLESFLIDAEEEMAEVFSQAANADFSEIKPEFTEKETIASPITDSQALTEARTLTKTHEIDEKIKNIRKRYETNENPLERSKLKKEIEDISQQLKKVSFDIETVDPQIGNKVQALHLMTAHNRSLFRIFIWRDMLIDLFSDMNFLGVDFGKPFLSESLEILGWGSVEWKRDGWVAAHNSFLNMIYRGGIFGLVFVLSIFTALFWLMVTAVKFNSLRLALLTIVLSNWVITANFLLILELPYNAISFWSIFGASVAYANKLKKNFNCENINCS